MKLSYLSAFAALTISSSVFALGPDSYIGSIGVMAGNYCPQGTLPADGRTLQISQYQALYSIIGFTYGGDGRTVFVLPNLNGRTPVGAGIGAGSGLSPVNLGQKRGSEFVTLNQAQLAAHAHAATFTPNSGANTMTVSIPVSSNTAGNKIAPDSNFSYMAGTPGGPSAANMWTDTMTNPVNVKGVTTSGGTTGGTVTVGVTGTNAPVPIIPPQIGMNYCIVVDGMYPPRPQ